MNSAYFTASGIANEFLDRWSSEISTYASLWKTHPNAADCARQRAEEARISYFAVSKVTNAIRPEEFK